MRLLCVTLLCTLWVVASYAAITSRVHAPRTARPREISLDSLREENKELQRESKASRQRRSTPGNDSFSHTSALTADNNPYALVHYSGAHSSLIFVVTQKYVNNLVTQSNIWRTTDLGQHYTNDTYKLPTDAIINDIHISLDTEKLILADQKHNRLYRTLDGGDTYLTTAVSFDPQTLLFHPNIVEVVLAYDSDHTELYVSSDFGANWTRISTGVHQYVWDHLATDATLYYETDEGNDTYLWKASVDSQDRMSNSKVDSLGAIESDSLVLYNEFIFVEKQLNQSDTTGEGGLFVSYKRGDFKEAMFPLKTQEQHYLIADASEEQALVAVYHYNNLTNLYTSDASGHSYSLSLQNLRGSGIDTWREKTATVELVKIEGIRGTYIANRLDPVSDDPRYWPVFTQVTYDKGGTWKFIQRPPYDSEGNPNDNCTLSEDCNLNLRIDQPSRSGVYSNEHALGMIVAHGNSGKYLNSYWWGLYYSNVYLSRDAGFTWTEEFYRGSYEYAFLDHGGVIAAVSRYSSGTVYTKAIEFSCTEGLAWEERNISQSRLYVIGMLTEPGSITLEATVFAKTPGAFVEWLIIQLNFSAIVTETCQAGDYVDWIPSDERQGGHCLLGEMDTYERRKPEVCCFNGRDYDRPINTSSCSCKLQDFDCDIGYEKLTTDSPCTLADGTVPPEAPIECPEGESYNLTLGYRLIPGDKCEGGDYHAYAPRTYLCPIRAPTSLIVTSDSDFYKVGETVMISLSQGYGSEKSTVYSWDFGDGNTLQLTGLSQSKTVMHMYAAVGEYTIQLSAANAGGVNDVSMVVSVLDVIQTVSFSSDRILIVGLREEFEASYTLQYNSGVIGTISYEWEVGADDVVTSPSPLLTHKFLSSGNVTIRLKVSNEVSEDSSVSSVLLHASSDNLRILQYGQTFAVNASVSLTLVSSDNTPLPTQGVSYKWDTGEQGAPEQNTSTPALTLRYPTRGDKIIKVHSVSTEDGTTINHVVSGTIHIIPEIGDVTSLHHTGTTDDFLPVNLTIRDVDKQPYVGPVTLLISDQTNNDWASNHHTSSVTDGTLMLTLSPLNKYTTYKVLVTLNNAISSASSTLEVSRVRNTEQSVVITLRWVDIPADTELDVWEQQVEDSVAQEIMDNFHFESWRLIVDLSVQENVGYTIHVRLLPNNETAEGMQELLTSLNQINLLFEHDHDIVVNGSTGTLHIPVISSTVNDGQNSVEKIYTLIGLSVGIPVLLVIFLLLLIPIIICGVCYIRKYRKVSHAYSRLRHTRANNFLFTHDGMDDDDDEPVSMTGEKTGSKKGNKKYDLEDNFERTGLDKQSAERNPIDKQSAERNPIDKPAAEKTQ